MRAIAKLVVVFLFALGGCHKGGTNAYAITVKYDVEKSADFIENVRVIVGTDKFWWPRINAAEEKSVTLRPTANSADDVTVLFGMKEKEHTWTGPLPASRRMVIVISGSGAVGLTR